MKIFRRLNRFIHRAALGEGTDAEGTISDITDGVSLRGARVWLLVCSALLASIGLDVNSTAIIIGAMLISPLMSPILGVGLSIATVDQRLLKESILNLFLAVGLALLASAFYFAISPFGVLTAEINARTTPTLLDVGVAFFGGIAGIVSGSRRVKTTAIPGVAIATALMPPVCTAGFGLAKADFQVFLGGFYLFFINAVFIAFATYLVAVLLRFPKHAHSDESQHRRMRFLVIVFVIVALVPSGFILFAVIGKARFESGINRFVKNELRRDEYQPVQWELTQSTDNPVLKVYTVGRSFDSARISELETTLKEYTGRAIKLDIIPLNVSPDEFKRLSSDIETNLAGKVALLEKVSSERQSKIDELQRQLTVQQAESTPHNRFLKDIRLMFPEVTAIEWQQAATDETNQPSNRSQTLMVVFRDDVSTFDRRLIEAQILRLTSRLREAKYNVVESEPLTTKDSERNESNENTKP